MNIKTSTSTTTYQDIGEGPSLVMLPGWGCDWQIWAPVVRGLSNHYRLIMPDLPVFGGSQITDGKVWDSFDYVEWLEEFLAEVLKKSDTYSLLGHSFGGKISALFTATKQPKKLQHLFIVDASGLPVELTSSQSLKSRLIQFVPSFFKAAIPTDFKQKMLGDLALSTDYLNANPAQKEVLKKIVHEDIAEYLPKISTPTTIIWGKNDLDTPVEKGREFARLIPKSNLIEFEQSGHFPFIDEAVRFVEMVSAQALGNSTKSEPKY